MCIYLPYKGLMFEDEDDSNNNLAGDFANLTRQKHDRSVTVFIIVNRKFGITGRYQLCLRN